MLLNGHKSDPRPSDCCTSRVRARDHLLLCGTHKFNSNDEEPAFGYARGPDEAKTWRDWLQTILLEQNGLVQISFERALSRRRSARRAIQFDCQEREYSGPRLRRQIRN